MGLLAAILMVTVGALPAFLTAAVFPRMGSEFGFGPAGLGVLSGVFFLAAAVSSTTAGRIVQRVGWRRAVLVEAFGAGVVLLLVGTVVRATSTLALLLALAGVVYALANPAANQVLADRGARALVFGAKHAGIPVATMLAGLAVPAVVAPWGWRAAFLAGLVLVPIVPLLARLVAPRPVSVEEPDDRGAGGVALPSRRLVLLAVGAAAATLAAPALGGYTVAAAVDAGFTEASAGLLLFAGSVASITARLAVGSITDRRRSSGFVEATVLIGAGAMAFALLAVSRRPWLAAVVVAAFATGWAWPGSMTFIVVNARRSTAAASTAVTQAGVFVGAGAGPVLIGALIARWGFPAAWSVVAGALVVAAGIVGIVGRAARRSAASIVRSS